MLLRCFFGGPHKLSGHKVMRNGLGLIAQQRFEFKLRLNGRGILFRVPQKSVRCGPWDSTRAAAVRRNLFQARFGRASDDEAMMGRIWQGYGPLWLAFVIFAAKKYRGHAATHGCQASEKACGIQLGPEQVPKLFGALVT